MDQVLRGMRAAILVEDGFEQVELVEPRQALDAAGADTRLVSPNPGSVTAWRFTEWGEEFPVDVEIDAADPQMFDALLVPGGVMSADKLRMHAQAVDFVRTLFEQRKPTAAICHGPWVLIDAGVVRGRRITSWPSLRADLRNAGAEWINEPVVVDGHLVTSRMPDDIPAFDRMMVDVFAQRRVIQPAA